MKKEINPVVAVVLVLLVVAAVGYLIYNRTAGSQPQYGAKIPETVMKEFKEKGPRPMPPVPMPGGESVPMPTGPPPGAPTGPSTGK
ncbi:MAG: hypothetical protein FJX72_18575 [Armatimonadetes bacterium]|nr:hypothetical protein [Armatimonadota bacterium]